ncbi:uncharacterized protein TNCV_3256981 [Trichonephila clavipes]|nr:uncharacterized protein TNCV_3256981 [Trichonephila clavipes]
MRLWRLWPRLALARYQSHHHPSPFSKTKRLNKTAWIVPPEHNCYQCIRPGGSLAHDFKRQDQTLLARFRSGHLKIMQCYEGCKNFEMCTNCSSGPASSAHILECLGLTKQRFSRRSLASVAFFESVQCHGPSLALLTNGVLQQFM